MAKDKEDKKIYTTPRGTAIYPSIAKPDFGSREYPDPDGSYKTSLKVPVADAQPMIELIDALHEDAVEAVEDLKKKHKADPKKKGKPFKEPTEHSPYYMEVDDEGNETGFVIFKFKCKASGIRKDETKWERKLPVYDAKGTIIKKVPNIGGGSTLRVGYTADSYASGVGFGVSLRMESVKLLELVEFGSNGPDAAKFGFDEEEEGYSVEDYEDEETTADSADDEEDDQEVDF